MHQWRPRLTPRGYMIEAGWSSTWQSERLGSKNRKHAIGIPSSTQAYDEVYSYTQSSYCCSIIDCCSITLSYLFLNHYNEVC